MNIRQTLFNGFGTAVFTVLFLLLVIPANAQEYKQSFNDGVEAAKAKNLESAVDHFNAAAEGAKTEGDTEVERRANGYIAKIEYSFGLTLMKTDSYADAIVHFDTGIERDPAYPKNYLARAKALKKKGEIDLAIAAYAETVSRAETAGDSKTGRTAKQAIRDHYIFLASTALSRNGSRTTRADADEALEALLTLQNFVPDEDADVFYYMAEIHKVNGEYANAVEVADQALELHRGSRTDKAKIYYVKGEALMALGNNPGAKEAFAGASYGSYKASAQHYIETLGTNN